MGVAEHLQHSGTLGQLPPMSYFPLAPEGLVTVQPSRDGYNPSFCFRRAKHHQSQLAIESQCLSLWPTSFLRVLFLTLFISYVGLSCTRVFFQVIFRLPRQELCRLHRSLRHSLPSPPFVEGIMPICCYGRSRTTLQDNQTNSEKQRLGNAHRKPTAFLALCV